MSCDCHVTVMCCHVTAVRMSCDWHVCHVNDIHHFPIDGKWVEVADVKVGLQEANEWFDSTNFTFDPALTIILVIRLTLRFSSEG